MKIYIYDGTFEGLLTVIFEIFKEKNYQVIIRRERNLLSNVIEIKTDYEKYERVLKSIESKLSKLILRNILYTFLSDDDNKEIYILKYLKFAFEKGKKVESYISDDRVKTVHGFVRKVGLEVQRLKGLIRFRELKDQTFYSIIEPDHNILMLLSDHFEKRFGNQNWVIHDIKRKKALIYIDKKVELVDIEANPVLMDKENSELLSSDENSYQNMWKSYFKSINIKERKNLKLQAGYMPRRYWKHLVEIS